MIANEVFLRFLEMIQWRCLVPTTSSQGPSVALHAKPSYDSSHSGTTIDAQLRYAARTNDMLDKYFKGEDFPAFGLQVLIS
ncbi:hypothetical protein MTR67_003146 [Solanum verrucosum]|uniref:Uncharacterized protein n=1 Tax=Solanum verrucosum TaxID=315347 RepID=A0AAF0PWB7_SOLVR|nr:hypothetical protein MTR67_003146 [Solanum verrucosum]